MGLTIVMCYYCVYCYALYQTVLQAHRVTTLILYTQILHYFVVCSHYASYTCMLFYLPHKLFVIFSPMIMCLMKN